MKPSKKLAPLKNRKSHYELSVIDGLFDDIDQVSRENRLNLKQYLSVYNMTTSDNLSKKKFELTESVISKQNTSRLLTKAINSTTHKTRSKEKYIDRMVTLQKANKHVLEAFHMLSPALTQNKPKSIELKIPDELKSLETEGLSERDEVLKLIDWFDSNSHQNLLKTIDEESFISKTSQDQSEILLKTQSFLNESFNKFFNLLQTECTERAAMFSFLFNSFEKLWKFQNLTVIKNQSENIKNLQESIDDHKTQLLSLSKTYSKNLKEVIVFSLSQLLT